MPIATAIAIFFVEPLILTLLAGPLLGERVGPRRLAAVGVGLAGVLIIVRSGGGLGPAALLPLLAAVRGRLPGAESGIIGSRAAQWPSVR